MRKRLDVQIDADHYDFIKEEADRSRSPMNAIADELLALGIATKRGEVIEQQSLPVIREIVQTELRKQLAQQRMDVREDMSLEFTNEIKAIQRASDNRLAALIVRTLRDANIARRLMFALLAKAHGPDFANKAYTDASEKAGRDIASRSTKGDTEA
jgi:hypothetical protein